MKKIKNKIRFIIIIIVLILLFSLLIFKIISKNNQKLLSSSKFNNTSNNNSNNNDYLEKFKIDEVYNSKTYGSIHYSVYIPDNYDKEKSYPLYITLPGYEGLYFQGVGINLKRENFATEALKINSNMIILAPQLNDWGELSANQTIALIEYYKSNYNISKVYANGYSGGGETMSLVLGLRADLIDAYLQVSSKWDGSYDLVVENEIPIYFVIGENDEYYGSNPTKKSYNTLYSLYQQKGLPKEKIDEILVLDVKEKQYFISRGVNNEHGGGGLIAFDHDIMNWLLTK